MFSPRGAGCPLLPRSNPENRLHRQRNRPTEQPLAPTHSCLIWRAGRSRLSFQTRVRSQLCLTPQGPGQPGDRLSPWASCHHPVSSSSGTLQGPRQRLGLAGKAHIHTEKGSQILVNSDLCLDPWVSARWATFRADPGELPGTQPEAAEISRPTTTNRCSLCAQLNVYHGSYRPGLF